MQNQIDDASPLAAFDEGGRAFFEATADGHLPLMKCNACGQFYLAPIEVCPADLSIEFSAADASGRGEVYTFGVVHHVYGPQYADRVPYNIAVIQLEEGPRFSSSLRDVALEDITVGMPVELFFEDEAGLSIPYFRPRAAR